MAAVASGDAARWRLEPMPSSRALSELESAARSKAGPAEAAAQTARSAERELDDVGGDAVVAHDHR